MILPPWPFSIIFFATAWVRMNIPRRSVATVASQSASVISRSGFLRLMIGFSLPPTPALFTRMSIRPFLHHAIGDGLDLVCFRDVEGGGKGFHARPVLDLLAGLLDDFLAPGAQNDRRTGIGQPLGDAPADTRGASGDEGHFTCQVGIGKVIFPPGSDAHDDCLGYTEIFLVFAAVLDELLDSLFRRGHRP